MDANRRWNGLPRLRSVLAAGYLVAAAGGAVAAEPCGADEVAAVLTPATANPRPVRLACDLVLEPGDVVTRRIVLAGRAASGVRIDCRGARIVGGGRGEGGGDAIVVRSDGRTAAERAADRPRSVTIAGCRIEGSIRILGLGPNGQAPAVRASSRSVGHTERAQAAAPTDVTLSDLDIVGTGRVPLYLGPGVTGVTLERSRISGRSDGPAIYLDAESGHNRIVGNRIAVATGRREQLAIDGSADNLVRENRFATRAGGGIALYRNCGEGGTVRHQAPRHNVVEDNEFVAEPGSGGLFGAAPAIVLGARAGWRWYCLLDRGLPFGSSADDSDHADLNVVAGNRFVGRSPEAAIRDAGSGNRIAGNREIARPSE